MILLIFAFHGIGHNRTIKVIEDTYVSEQFPNTNYGSDDYLRVGNFENYGKLQAFYYFDVSSLPDGWLRAQIFARFDYGSDFVDVGVNVTYDSWDEMSLTWNNKPTISDYQGHILCDGFDFRIPLQEEHIVDGTIGVFLYRLGGAIDGHIQASSKEGASSSSDIAWIELHYIGIDPIIINGLRIAGIAIGICVVMTLVAANPKKKRIKRVKRFGEDWIDGNKNQTNNPRVNRNPVDIRLRDMQLLERQAQLLDIDLAELRARRRNDINGHIRNIPAHMRPSPAKFEKKINDYITLRFENYRTIIYVAGKQIIQCVHLILNIPKDKVPVYDEIDSIDEAADLYRRQGHHIPGMGLHAGHSITPEQEFWGHCSNIQAWVENNYDTRILMSNLSFPLLRELTRAGDPIARKVYKEEIALRLEGGYPSVVQYLLTQGYIGVFSPPEFKSILEATDIIKNLSTSPGMLNQFIRSCFYRFPMLIEDILLQILKLQDGKNIIFSIVQKGPVRFPLLISWKENRPGFLNGLLTNLESLLSKVEEDKIREEILDCVNMIKKSIQEMNIHPSDIRKNRSFENFPEPTLIERLLDLAGEDQGDREFLRERVLERIREQQGLMRDEVVWRARMRRPGVRCSFCGRVIHRGQDTCEWCGHRRDDDDDDFFPFPFIFRRPDGGGGGGGSMKGVIAVPVINEA